MKLDRSERRELGDERGGVLLRHQMGTEVSDASKLTKLGVLKRLRVVRDSRPEGEQFTRSTSEIIGDNLSQLLREGIVPVVITDENPFGEPLVAHSNLDVGIARLEGNLPEKYAELVPRPSGPMSLVITPFELGHFIEPTPVDELEEVWDVDRLGFQIEDRQASHMGLALCKNGEWTEGHTIPVATLSNHPNMQAIHYGSALFEGMGVEIETDGESASIFRLKEHWERMNKGAKFLKMPEIPFEIFEKLVREAVIANKKYLPPHSKGRLYIRPNYFDSGAHLKVGHSKEFTFCITAVPIGTSRAYFETKEGEEPKPVEFALALNRSRAVEHGVGESKAAGNYAATIGDVDAAKKALGENCKGVVYTSPNGEIVRESQASGVIFVEYGEDGAPDTIVFPNMSRGDILDSITMKTIYEIAPDLGYKVETRDVGINDLNKYQECMAVGTAAGVTPIHKLVPVEYSDEGVPTKSEKVDAGSYPVENNGPGRVAKEIFEYICQIKSGQVEKHSKMLTKVDLKKAA